MSPVTMYKLFVLSLFAAVVAGQMTQAMRDRILSDHNTKRRQATNAANMIELRYDMVLEQVAQAYLNRGCGGGFQHNPNRGCEYKSRGGTNGGTGSCASVGENWYSGYTDNTQGVDVVIGGAVAQWTDGRCSSWASPPLRCNSYWCSEKQNFYQSGSDSYGACTQTSGQVLHYTQTMWATTTHVGCGYTAACGTLCNYAMAGNMNLPSMGQMRESNIWKIGTPCSACPSGYTRCNAGLCSATTSTSVVTSAPTPTSCPGDTTSKPTNGNIGTCGSSASINSYCTQTCNSGYTLTSGSLSRQCKSGGVWASTTAVCSAVYVPPATQAPVTGSYCTSGPQKTEDTEIGAVTLNGDGSSIRDNSGCPGNVGPLDLTYLSTSLTRGQRYTITIDRTTCGDYYVALLGAWIDWDGDRSWESSELLFPFSQQIGTASFTFTVPSNARLGQTRMRIQAQEIGSTATTSINPCATFNWGDTKDYTIYVTAGTAALEADERVAVAVDHVCVPDASAPQNGGQGTCSGVSLLGQSCTQTCDDGFQLRPGTSLDRECTTSGYAESTAVCE